ncbi:MAG: ATP-dependent protease ATPase subunit HslU [Hyphomonas sp. TMED17]|nr:MAG: ATP-dependent protease ATPase subunit HslU [Hyphomonas sp. TMED17]
MPELQGRLPIRVELGALSRDDLRRILVEPEASLIRQHRALLASENLNIIFEEDALDQIADLAVKVNQTVENIGARRLQTILEKLLDDISFEADKMSDQTVTITANYVRSQVAELAENTDLSKFIL